jgi:hypothetical protein
MSDDWEDWENNDYTIPVLNEEQLKRLQERKLVEDSDNVITKDLFSNDDDEDLVYEDLKKLEENKVIIVKQIKVEKEKPKNKINNQKINEEKQKELSKKNKEEKANKKKAKEIFGEAEYDDEYAKYEEQFY